MVVSRFRPFLFLLSLVALASCATDDGPDGGGAAAARRTFDVQHQVKLQVPEGSEVVRVWMAMPQDDPAQDIAAFTVDAPCPHRIGQDSEGNKVLYFECRNPRERELEIVNGFTVTRREVTTDVRPERARPLTAAERADLQRYLAPNEHVIIDDRIRTLSAQIVGGEANPVVAARRIYDWTLDNIEYWVKDPANKKASPVGSTEHCLTTRTGNCTDFHSLWASLARAAGIPTRIVYGVFMKKELDGQDVDASYHCWPEFYAGGIGWIPHDVAVADIYHGSFALNEANATSVRRTTADGYQGPDPHKVDYYFGNLEPRRVAFSSGRDLLLDPAPAAGRVNALPKVYVEVDGKPLPEKTGWTRKLTFVERM